MWNDTDRPLAYLISFRTHGTWLHGDPRGSIDRHRNRYNSPYIPPNNEWQSYSRRQMRGVPLILQARERRCVESAIRETSEIRQWLLLAVNARTNHVHAVVDTDCVPERVLNAYKANATRLLRANRLWREAFSPWADKGSCRRLWNEQSVARAVDYVLNGQGFNLPDFDD